MCILNPKHITGRIYPIICLFLFIFSGKIQATEINMPPPYTWKNLKYSYDVPQNTYLKVMIVSTRSIDHNGLNYEINHGMDRNTSRTFFLACFFEDSVALVPQKSLYNGLVQMSKTKNFLMYVNGHGKNIRNMVSRGYELSINYEVNLILFDWPTNNILLGSTATNAWMSAPNFSKTMLDLAVIKEKLIPEKAISVVFHSMGALVLKAFTGNPALGWIKTPFIDNIIVSAGAAPARNHQKWLSKLNIQKNLYITYNKNDRTLRGAALLMMEKMMGHGPLNTTAKNAEYIDFTSNAGLEHNYFLNRNNLHNRNPEIEIFFHHVFNGRNITIEDSYMHENDAASIELYGY